MSRTLVDLIHFSKANKSRIKKEFKKLEKFHRENPWLLKEKMVEQLGEVTEEQFEKAIQIDDSLLLDDLSKVYSQVSKNNPSLIDQPCSIFYYSIHEGLYKSQTAEGYQKGEFDKRGFIVSGSDIILETSPVDLKSFLSLYFSTCN